MPTLEWIGRRAVLDHHRHLPFPLLRRQADLSVGGPQCGNLLVEGDNLLALKALLPHYAGKVHCVYIDPPYNRGGETWVYNDAVNSPEMRAWLGAVVGGESADLSRHDKWLCMMYPRLVLLRELLDDGGAIFVSIDDTEAHHLRMLLDEIFGPRNFIANIVWQKKPSPQNDAVNLSDMHDHVVAYAKLARRSRDDVRGWRRLLLPRSDAQDGRYGNPDDDPRGSWTSADYTCNKSAEERPNLYYPVVNPNTGQEIWPSPRRVWAFDRQAHDRNVREGRVWWGKAGAGRPRLKKFLSEGRQGVVPSTWWTRQFAGDNQEARRELRALFPRETTDFRTPKPVRLLRRILQIAADADAIVLDSFAGSGTTGHAVLAANQADGGRRRFLLVERQPDVCRNIAQRRLAQVAAACSPPEGQGPAPGFHYCTLADPLFDHTGAIRPDPTLEDLAAHVWFAETGRPLPDPAAASPLLGCRGDTAIYLLRDGALTAAALACLPPHDGPQVIYAPACDVSPRRLGRHRAVFRPIPRRLELH